MCWRGFKGRQLRKMMDLQMLLCFPACLLWVAPEYMCVCMVYVCSFLQSHYISIQHKTHSEFIPWPFQRGKEIPNGDLSTTSVGIIRESFCDKSQSQIRSKVMHSFGKIIVAVHTLVPDLLVLQLLCACACACVCACTCAQGRAHVFSLLLCVCV